MTFTQGDLIVVYVTVGSGQTVSSITDSGSPSSTYAKRVSAINGNSITYLYTSTAASSTSNTITVTMSASGDMAIAAAEYSGVVGFGASNTSTGTGTALSVSMTTQHANSWVLVAYGWTGSGVHSGDTGFVDRHAGNPSNQGLDYGDTGAAKQVGTYSYSATFGASNTWAMIALEISNSSSTTGPSAVAGPTCGENDPQGTTTSTGSYTSTSGDIIAVVAGTMHGPITFTSSMVTDTIGNTYSLRTSNTDVGVWTATAKSTGTNIITFTNSGSSTYYAICAEEYSGASVGTNVNTSSGSGTSLTVAVSGASSTSWVVGGFISWDTTSISMSSPDVQRQYRANFNLNVDEGDVPASSSTTLTASLSASQSWYGAAIELKPSS